MLRKILLFPFALLYGIIISIRNYLYDKKIIKSTKFTFPIICIGNLSVGGTGKTPHTNYLINLLKNEYNVAVLSRGYNRKQTGFIEVLTDSKAVNVGDEPLFYKWKHKEDITVAVCEDRVFGVSQIANLRDKEFVYLLDDAFQHRAIRAGINIVLTEYGKIFTDDMLLPSGNLREPKKGIKRADIIIVTKCPSPMDFDDKQIILREINPEKYQLVFFSTMQYKDIYPILMNEKIENEQETDVILVSGIANPSSMINELSKRFRNVYERTFSDHYNYSKEDIFSIIRTFKNLEVKNKIIITTEKDATRLFAFKDLFLEENINIFCLPIEVKFENDEKNAFDNAIKHYLNITLPPKPIEEFNIL